MTRIILISNATIAATTRQGRIWGGSKAPKEPPELHRGFLEPPVDLVGKNFKNVFIVKGGCRNIFYILTKNVTIF